MSKLSAVVLCLLIAPQFVGAQAAGALTLRLSGENVAAVTKEIAAGGVTENLRLVIEYVVPPVHESVVIVDSSLDPGVARRPESPLAIDNLFNKQYFETQNYFESRVRAGDESAERIHATPGYPFGVTVGLTFRFGGK